MKMHVNFVFESANSTVYTKKTQTQIFIKNNINSWVNLQKNLTSYSLQCSSYSLISQAEMIKMKRHTSSSSAHISCEHLLVEKNWTNETDHKFIKYRLPNNWFWWKYTYFPPIGLLALFSVRISNFESEGLGVWNFVRMMPSWVAPVKNISNISYNYVLPTTWS